MLHKYFRCDLIEVQLWKSLFTVESAVFDDKPNLHGIRVTVGTAIGLVTSGYTFAEILGHPPIWKKRIFGSRRPMRPPIRELN